MTSSCSRCADGSPSLVLGDGLDDATDVGPVINDKAVERIAAYAAIGRGEAELVIGGEPARDGELAKGSFFQPTIFAEVQARCADRPGGDLRPGDIGHSGR